MTEQPPTSGSQESGETPELPTGDPTWTGVPAVDQVLRDVEDLDGVPLEEHLGRFERAHETLRSALDADPGEPVDPA